MAILTPVETEEVFSDEDVLGLVDPQVVNFHDFVGYCCKALVVERVKLDAEDALVAVFFNLRLGGPGCSSVAKE